MCCSVLQICLRAADDGDAPVYVKDYVVVLQCGAGWCSVVQCVASVLQCSTVCCRALQICVRAADDSDIRVCVTDYISVCCSVLQCSAVFCSVLQCVAVCRNACSVLWCVAVCCGVLQCAAVCCSLL